MFSFYVRPPEIEDRQFPSHWEDGLIKGEAYGSAVGTLVERTSRLLMLIKLPEVKTASALNVLQDFTDKLLSIALPLRLSITYDQGHAMATHKELSKRTGIAVYFCEPHSLWQRGLNENMNGLVRQYQYLPKAPTCLFTARKKWMRLPTKSTTAQEKVWADDRHCLFTVICLQTASNNPRSYTEVKGVALYF